MSTLGNPESHARKRPIKVSQGAHRKRAVKSRGSGTSLCAVQAKSTSASTAYEIYTQKGGFTPWKGNRDQLRAILGIHSPSLDSNGMGAPGRSPQKLSHRAIRTCERQRLARAVNIMSMGGAPMAVLP